MSSKIEYSNQGGKFTAAEIRSNVAKSKAFWNSPEGKRKSAQLEVERRTRKPSRTKFPDLAKQGTRPAMSTSAARARLLDRL
jgi:hypothetical protein